ncbi:DUF1173 family protein [Pollutimonas bauzanensis]|uniref:DUF1173 family protein n=1 Tax=Pollutimonas bauzanensis TaxID=658167 RepID=A0A1M5YLY8_9BURK|nr:DUF1173 family protein [Pollutimonas bauzanensis]SHI12543.1 Protein of unknown function [Pollutimonas bauzanensis]
MKEYKSYPVEVSLAGQTKTYSPEFQTDDQFAYAWKKVLVMAHGKAVVRCLCAGMGEKRLSIHSRSNSDRFHLARFPETGPEHAEDCVFYSVDPNASGMGAYKRGVIQELDDGNTKIKLKIGLQQRVTKAPTDNEAPASNSKTTSQSRVSQSSMTLLGLLHYLWTQAALNTWTPAMLGKRNLGVVHHHLMRVAMTTYAGRVKLAQNLLIGTPSPEGQQPRLNQAKAISASNERRRLVVAAPLARHREGLENARTLPISGFHGIPYLDMGSELWQITKRRFGSEVSAWIAGNPVMMFAQTDPPKTAAGALQAHVIDLALMWMTKDWIPVDSGFEALLAERLVQENRRFEKPLRFDSHEHVFPDFWLKDTGAPVPMEVWGMATPDYQARKQEKIAHYDSSYGPGNWWSWNGAAGDELPELPSRSL